MKKLSATEVYLLLNKGKLNWRSICKLILLELVEKKVLAIKKEDENLKYSLLSKGELFNDYKTKIYEMPFVEVLSEGVNGFAFNQFPKIVVERKLNGDINKLKNSLYAEGVGFFSRPLLDFKSDKLKLSSRGRTNSEALIEKIRSQKIVPESSLLSEYFWVSFYSIGNLSVSQRSYLDQKSIFDKSEIDEFLEDDWLDIGNS